MIFNTEGLANITSRMCHHNTCAGCPLENELSGVCGFLMCSSKMNETLGKIKEWNDTHPPVSNMQKFREVFDYQFLEMPDPRSSFWTEEYKGDTK